jgi:hypothetical protein
MNDFETHDREAGIAGALSRYEGAPRAVYRACHRSGENRAQADGSKVAAAPSRTGPSTPVGPPGPNRAAAGGEALPCERFAPSWRSARWPGR